MGKILSERVLRTKLFSKIKRKLRFELIELKAVDQPVGEVQGLQRNAQDHTF